MTKKQALNFVESHDDSDTLDRDDLIAAFTALYDREPNEYDIAEGLWSHCCAAPVWPSELED